MKTKAWKLSAGLCFVVACAIWAAPANAQTSPVQEKSPNYCYVANWQLPRAQWGAIEKSNEDDMKLFEKAAGEGTITAYGFDETLTHTADGETHDEFWCASSQGGLFNMLDQFYKAGTTTSPVLQSATKHWDEVWVSRYHDWHPGSYKDIYTSVSTYRLKPTAPDDALDSLSKSLVAPLLEKLLADGTLVEWEIDTQAVHTDAPGEFMIVFLAQKPDAMDKVDAAIVEVEKSDSLGLSAFGAAVDDSSHRDEVLRTTAVFK